MSTPEYRDCSIDILEPTYNIPLKVDLIYGYPPGRYHCIKKQW